MTVHARHRRKRSGLPSAHLPEATRPHEMWADDVVHARGAHGEGLTCLVVVDEDSRLCLAIEVGRRIASEQVIQALMRLIQLDGVPRDIRRDNGPEFVAQAVRAWLSVNGINTLVIAQGKPWQNGAVESCIGRFRDEGLNMEWFLSRREARVIMERYRQQ
jgi:putative transposase